MGSDLRRLLSKSSKTCFVSRTPQNHPAVCYFFGSRIALTNSLQAPLPSPTCAVSTITDMVHNSTFFHSTGRCYCRAGKEKWSTPQRTQLCVVQPACQLGYRRQLQRNHSYEHSSNPLRHSRSYPAILCVSEQLIILSLTL